MGSLSFSGFANTVLSKERPVGINLLAGFFLLYGVYRSLRTLSLLRVLFIDPGGMLVAPVLAIFYLVETSFLFAGGVLLVMVGIGLLNLNKWARIGVIAWMGLQSLLVVRIAVFSASRGLPVPVHGFRSLLVGLIFACVVAYLFRPEVKQAFNATQR
jgi:hypothetical protein